MPPNTRLHPRSTWSSGAGSWLPSSGSGLQIRVGVATGLVVVADVADHEASRPHRDHRHHPGAGRPHPVGSSPNSVVVAEATYRLTSGAFDFEEIGSTRAEGLRRAGQVVAAGGQAEAVRPLHRPSARVGATGRPRRRARNVPAAMVAGQRRQAASSFSCTATPASGSRGWSRSFAVIWPARASPRGCFNASRAAIPNRCIRSWSRSGRTIAEATGDPQPDRSADHSVSCGRSAPTSAN